MKVMNIPGFTAETSIYKTGVGYRSTAEQCYSIGEHRVVAQLLRGGFGVGGLGNPAVVGFWDDVCYGACVLGCAALAPELIPACIAACDLACY